MADFNGGWCCFRFSNCMTSSSMTACEMSNRTRLSRSQPNCFVLLINLAVHFTLLSTC